jgi:Na+/H+ antiporter NhaD/arsenite permease-like protein
LDFTRGVNSRKPWPGLAWFPARHQGKIMHAAAALARHVDTGSYAFIVATAILVITYAIIISERVNRAVIALLGAGAMVILGIINQEEAIRGIDFNTIALLAGMMMIVGVTKDCGLFQFIAIRAVQFVRASPAGVLALMSVVTAVFSAFLDNVTTVLLVVPVVIALTRELKIPPYPFLLTTVLASNIGGTATLIGDPPNILIGSAAHLPFNDFVINLGPIIVVILAVQLVINHLLWGAWLKAAPADRAHVMARKAIEEIKDFALLWKSLFVLGIVMLAFVLHAQLKLEAGTIAMTGAALLIFLDNLSRHHHAHHEHVTRIFHEVEWITLFFFVGLFIVIAGVDKAGLISLMAHELLKLTGGDYKVTGFSILWGSAIFSSIVDNIPFVATMIPLIKSLGPALGGPEHLRAYWWALSLGACLGGNGTLVGASANLTVAGIAERMGVRFGFVKFTLYAFWMMLISVGIAHIYLMLRFF